MNKLSKKYKVIYCFSRRTPEKIKTYIINNMQKYHDYYPKKALIPIKITEFIELFCCNAGLSRDDF